MSTGRSSNRWRETFVSGASPSRARSLFNTPPSSAWTATSAILHRNRFTQRGIPCILPKSGAWCAERSTVGAYITVMLGMCNASPTECAENCAAVTITSEPRAACTVWSKARGISSKRMCRIARTTRRGLPPIASRCSLRISCVLTPEERKGRPSAPAHASKSDGACTSTSWPRRRISSASVSIGCTSPRDPTAVMRARISACRDTRSSR